MRRLRAVLSVLGLAALTGPAAAHPHIFIDAGLKFEFDAEGRLAAVRVNWVYDELYSLMLVEDQGLDPDGDGVLTEEEVAHLAERDRDWAPDYEGDLYGTADGAPIALGPPESFGLDYVDGRILSTHRRPLAVPVDPAEAAVAFRNYDPWYYAAFALTLPLAVEGRDCTLTVVPADRTAAEDKLAAALRATPDGGAMIEQEFPKVGGDFADEVRLACAAPS